MNSHVEMSNAVVTCTGCRSFNDSLTLLRESNSSEGPGPWCVHVLSVMKAYECVLRTLEAREGEVERSTLTNVQMSAFQAFILRSYNDRRTCVPIRTWGIKAASLVIAPDLDAYSENVPPHAICTVRQISSTLKLISCSNVSCRKGKNKKVKQSKIPSEVCCHLRHLLETQALQPGVTTAYDIDDGDDIEDEMSYEEDGKLL